MIPPPFVPLDYVPMTMYRLAERYIGIQEVAGTVDNPIIMAMLKLDDPWPEHDEVPWCSAAMNWWAWHLRLPRSKSKLARSWLGVGRGVSLAIARPKNDLVIFQRGGGEQPGPDNMTAPGHVALFSHAEGNRVWVLGGNQGNSVSVSPYQRERVLGVRRLLG